jgi:hypothetical protein
VKFFKLSSLSLSLTVLSVLCAGFSAQAETASTTFSVTEAPVTEATTSISPISPAIAPAEAATDIVTEADIEVASDLAIAPTEATATTVPSATLDSLTAQQLLAHHTSGHAASTTLAHHTPGHAASTTTEASAAITPEVTETSATVAPETAEAVAETQSFTPDSTTAADLTPATAPTDSTAEIAPTTSEQSQVAQIPTSPVLTRPPANNYIGAGVNFGDDTSFAVVSKFAITQFSDYGVSLRPSVLFGDSVNFRVPITIESRLNTESEQANRFAPYAGLGVAIDTDDDDEGDSDIDNDDDGDDDVGFMLTAGSDFLLTNRITATAGLNLIFNDDTDLELLLGVGYNF